MPQMAPLMWLSLFKFFTTCFSIFIALTYFIKLPVKIQTPKSKMPSTKLNWKW